jgi:hypothetical protein
MELKDGSTRGCDTRFLKAGTICQWLFSPGRLGSSRLPSGRVPVGPCLSVVGSRDVVFWPLFCHLYTVCMTNFDVTAKVESSLPRSTV